MYLTDYKSNLHALTLYINLQEKINKGIPLTLVPKTEEPIKTMALPTVNSDSDTNLDQNATTWAIFEAESPPEEHARHHQTCQHCEMENREKFFIQTKNRKKSQTV